MTRVLFGVFEHFLSASGRYGGAEDLTGESEVSFKKSAGDAVSEGDVIALYEDDKAVIEIPAPVSGTIVSLSDGSEWGSSGEQKETPFGTLLLPALGEIETEGSKESKELLGEEKETEDLARGRLVRASRSVSEMPGEGRSRETNGQRDRRPCSERADPLQSREGVRAVPAARELARSHGVSLENIKATGKDGVVMLCDVEKVCKDLEKERKRKGVVGSIGATYEGEIDIGASPMRRAIAGHVELAKREILQSIGDKVTIDIATLEQFREKCNRYGEPASGIHLRLDHVYAYLIAQLLKRDKFRVLNGYWDKKRKSVILNEKVNLAIAVQTKKGLMTPVVHNAGSMSFIEFARAFEDIIGRAHTARLTHAHFLDGTVTFNNPGRFGGEDPRPMVPMRRRQDGTYCPTTIIFALGKVMCQGNNSRYANLSFSFDHRSVDGFEPLSCAVAIKNYIEGAPRRKQPDDFLELFNPDLYII